MFLDKIEVAESSFGGVRKGMQKWGARDKMPVAQKGG